MIKSKTKKRFGFICVSEKSLHQISIALVGITLLKKISNRIMFSTRKTALHDFSL